MLYPHTVTHYRATSRVDGDGNPIREPSTVGVPVAAFVQPRRHQRPGSTFGHRHRGLPVINPRGHDRSRHHRMEREPVRRRRRPDRHPRNRRNAAVLARRTTPNRRQPWVAASPSEKVSNNASPDHVVSGPKCVPQPGGYSTPPAPEPPTTATPANAPTHSTSNEEACDAHVVADADHVADLEDGHTLPNGCHVEGGHIMTGAATESPVSRVDAVR